LSGYNAITGAAARWIFSVNASRDNDPSQVSKPLSVTLFVMDTDYESQIGLAHNWPYRALDTAEVHVSAPLLRALNVFPNKGERIRIQFDFLSNLGVGMGTNSTDLLSQILPPTVSIPIRLATVLPPQALAALNLTGFNASSNIPLLDYQSFISL
jgi:hypothetical protein